MARGKQTCKILKEIRRQIAEANDIEFVTSECRYKGDCSGTCPKCEAELRYLEQQLRKRQLAGKLVNLAGISAGAISMLATCAVQAQTPDTNLLKVNVPIQAITKSINAKETVLDNDTLSNELARSLLAELSAPMVGGIAMPVDRDNMLDLQIIDENGKTIPYETVSIERVYIDEDGEEDSDYLETSWIEEKGVHRLYWKYEPELQDENGSPLKEAKLRIEVEGYDEPKTLKVKYPKRNTRKIIKFKNSKKK